MGFDDILLSAHTTPPLTTVHYPFDESAKNAILNWIDYLYRKVDFYETWHGRSAERRQKYLIQRADKRGRRVGKLSVLHD